MRAGVLDAVGPPRLDVDVREPGGVQLLRELALLERAGDAADPQLHPAADLRRDLAADDDILGIDTIVRP